MFVKFLSQENDFKHDHHRVVRDFFYNLKQVFTVRVKILICDLFNNSFFN